MLMPRNPGEAYRRIDFDARVAGADPQTLVLICYEALEAALGSALFADERGDNRAKSAALTRALSAVTALQLGLQGDAAVTTALRQFLEASRRALLDAALAFDAPRVAAMRADFRDIGQAMRAASGALAA